MCKMTCCWLRYWYYETKIDWKYVSTYEIRNIIKSLKPKNTYGYDEILNRIIKLSSPYIISPLTYICNAALNSGVFPDRLKYAIVKPIHKKGSKQDISIFINLYQRMHYILTKILHKYQSFI